MKITLIDGPIDPMHWSHAAAIAWLVGNSDAHGFHHFGQLSALASRDGKLFPNVSFIGFTRSL